MTIWQAVGFSLAPHIGGILGGMITRPQIKTWYEKLNKPNWRPPNWAFAPVWTTLYTGMGYASYLVYRDGGGFSGDALIPLSVYGAQLALNWAWSPVFFKAHKLGLSLAIILEMDVLVTACIALFHPINPSASYLMVPYLAWLSLATALNYYIWKNNPKPIEDATEKKEN